MGTATDGGAGGMGMTGRHLIAIDWGTSRLRGFLVAPDGSVSRRVESDDGVANVAAGAHPEIVARVCAPLLTRFPEAPVIMAGMIGSRNGWFEVPYVACPASRAELTRQMGQVNMLDGRRAAIVPGVMAQGDQGESDVMRGEETLVVGSGVEDGVIVLPGTHSKWVEVRRGRIVRFTTYLTGELFDLVRRHGFVARLAEEPQDQAGFTRGLGVQSRAIGRATAPAQDAISALGLPGNDRPTAPSLLSTLFEARAAVLLGRMHPRQVIPFISGLLIGDEVAHGRAEYCGQARRVHVIAQEPHLGLYRQAFASQRIEATTLSPETCLVQGLRSLAPGPVAPAAAAIAPSTETGLPFLRSPF